jgi:hypothetical protein
MTFRTPRPDTLESEGRSGTGGGVQRVVRTGLGVCAFGLAGLAAAACDTPAHVIGPGGGTPPAAAPTGGAAATPGAVTGGSGLQTTASDVERQLQSLSQSLSQAEQSLNHPGSGGG